MNFCFSDRLVSLYISDVFLGVNATTGTTVVVAGTSPAAGTGTDNNQAGVSTATQPADSADATTTQSIADAPVASLVCVFLGVAAYVLRP